MDSAMPTAFVDRNRSRARRSWAYVASGSTGRSTSIRRTNSVCAILGSIRFTGVRAHDPGGLKLLPLIITSIAESLVRCRNSGVRAIPRVAAGAANDLATEFEGRSAADVAGWRRVRIDERGRGRFCGFHAGPHKAIGGKMSVALPDWSL